MSAPRVHSFRFGCTALARGLLGQRVNLYEVRDGDGALLWVCRAVARCLLVATEFRDVEHGPVRYRMHPARPLLNRSWRLVDPERIAPFATVTSAGGGLWRLLDVRGVEQARIVHAAGTSPPAAAAGVPYVLTRDGAVAGHVREHGGVWLLDLAHESEDLDPRVLVAAIVLLREHTIDRRHRLRSAG